MPSMYRLALILVAFCAIPTGASAQKVYKCGSSYSQTPCVDGVAIQADDTRSAAQKAAAEKVARSDAKLGQDMEKARLKDDAKANAILKAAKDSSKSAKKEEAPAKKKKNKEPEYFTAKNPADSTKK